MSDATGWLCPPCRPPPHRRARAWAGRRPGRRRQIRVAEPVISLSLPGRKARAAPGAGFDAGCPSHGAPTAELEHVVVTHKPPPGRQGRVGPGRVQPGGPQRDSPAVPTAGGRGVGDSDGPCMRGPACTIRVRGGAARRGPASRRARAGPGRASPLQVDSERGARNSESAGFPFRRSCAGGACGASAAASGSFAGRAASAARAPRGGLRVAAQRPCPLRPLTRAVENPVRKGAARARRFSPGQQRLVWGSGSDMIGPRHHRLRPRPAVRYAPGSDGDNYDAGTQRLPCAIATGSGSLAVDSDTFFVF